MAFFFGYLSQSERLSYIKLPLGRYERESTIIIPFMISRDRLAISQSSNTRLVKKMQEKSPQNIVKNLVFIFYLFDMNDFNFFQNTNRNSSINILKKISKSVESRFQES